MLVLTRGDSSNSRTAFHGQCVSDSVPTGHWPLRHRLDPEDPWRHVWPVWETTSSCSIQATPGALDSESTGGAGVWGNRG